MIIHHEAAGAAIRANDSADDAELFELGLKFKALLKTYFQLKKQQGECHARESNEIEAVLDELSDQICQNPPKSLRTMAVCVLCAAWESGRDTLFEEFGYTENDARFSPWAELVSEAFRQIDANTHSRESQ